MMARAPIGTASLAAKLGKLVKAAPPKLPPRPPVITGWCGTKPHPFPLPKPFPLPFPKPFPLPLPGPGPLPVLHSVLKRAAGIF